MRAFFSVDLPDDLAGPLADAQATLEGADGLNFVDPQQAHVTLKFLGDVPASAPDATDLDDVLAAGERAVARAAVDPFACRVAGLGVFPSLGYVSVVWVGVDEGGEALTRLHEALEAETTAIGFDPETHEFTPHVTLARMTDARGKELVQTAVRERDPVLGQFEVDEFRLTASTVTPDGPVYETVETFPL
ncbi:RNA 2',3'-cyclic phosphodiesterase [Halorubrum sp. DTA98]|uniref:RNA 2',3'-cyclic phosphodiesterase n=1 Tax=Halorubrum sp. DTA98 TaxID=3402163 RepID=UPI003AAA4125